MFYRLPGKELRSYGATLGRTYGDVWERSRRGAFSERLHDDQRAFPSSTAPYTPEFPDPNGAPYLKSIPGTLSVRCLRRGAFRPTQSSRNSLSKSTSMVSIMGSKPRAVTFRVRAYRTSPRESRVRTRVPVSFAWRIAGETNGCRSVSPCDNMLASDIAVSYGAGGSISSS